MKLKGEVAFITGGSRGIGRAIAISLAQNGAKVFVVARNEFDLKETVIKCQESVASITKEKIAHHAALDVCDMEKTKEAMEECVKVFGKLSILINNVGLNKITPISSSSPNILKEIDQVMDVTLKSVMHTCVYATRHLLKNVIEETPQQRENKNRPPVGQIVIINSMLAKSSSFVPGSAAYVAAKTGIEGFADSLWTELRPLNIRVSSVFPGLVNTDMGEGFKHDVFGNLFDRNITGEDFLQPTDIADAVIAVLTASPTCCITELELTPQKDFFRQSIFTQKEAVNEMLDSLESSIPVCNKTLKAAIITGAGRGIGRDAAVSLAADGFDVSLIARTAAELEETARQCKATNPFIKTLTFPLDVTNSDDLARAVKSTVDAFGGLSLVLNNAGINRRRSSALTSLQVWEQVVKINLIAAMDLSRLCVPFLMLQVRRNENLNLKGNVPSIIFVNTHYSHPKSQPMPGVAPYITSKAGLYGFSKALLEDIRNWGVHVCTLTPGLVNTDLGNKPGPIGMLINNEDKIQNIDLIHTIKYVINAKSNCCPLYIMIDSRSYAMPTVRVQNKKFLQQYSSEDVALTARL